MTGILGWALAGLSVAAATTSLWIVRRDRFLTFAILLTYVVWHAPLILSAILPFEVPIQSPGNLPYIVLILASIHTIVAAGVCGYLLAGGPSGARPPQHRLEFGKLFVFVAYLGTLFVAVDAFVFRASFSLDLGANRAAYTDVDGASIFGQLGILLGGLALYLLLAKPFSIRTLALYGTPYFLGAAIQMLVGNRQFMLMGLILLVLTFVASRRPPLLGTVGTGSILVVVFVLVMVGFGAVRQAATKGVQDVALASLMNVEILDYDHPLTRTYTARTTSLYLYLYYGIEHDMAASIMRNVDFRAPFLSLTVPIVYRRFSSFAGLPDQAGVMKGAADAVEAGVGVYPNVWATMFTQAYYEGGYAGIAVLVMLLAAVNFLLIWYLTRRSTNGSLNAATIFYAFLIFGLQFMPTREGAITGLLLVAFSFAILQALSPREARPRLSRDLPLRS